MLHFSLDRCGDQQVVIIFGIRCTHDNLKALGMQINLLQAVTNDMQIISNVQVGNNKSADQPHGGQPSQSNSLSHNRRYFTEK